jgi:hypothetical protein
MSITSYKTYDKTVARLAELSFFISKYSHLWNTSRSPRLSNWVQEYNQLRSELSWEQWKEYCTKYDYAPTHDGYDCLA